MHSDPVHTVSVCAFAFTLLHLENGDFWERTLKTETFENANAAWTLKTDTFENANNNNIKSKCLDRANLNNFS